ncbi:MAG: inositol monophosphatase family protein [Saprospiraceae bacterium]
MNYQKICAAAEQVVMQAGAFIRGEYGKVSRQSIEEKSVNQLVTYVDRTAEEMLVKGLRQIVPTATFLTEEATIASENSDLQWIIDPLDGTTNFLHGIPTFAVSVALQQGEQIVVGIVYEVNQDECFAAWQGGGAWLNGERIRVGTAKNLAQALIGTGFPVDNFTRLNPMLKATSHFIQHSRGVRRVGSAATDLAYVACGRYDAFFEYNLNPWDVAAGVLLVQEAGGQLSDFTGTDHYIFGREMLATNQLIHEEMLTIIRQAFYPTMPSV